MFVSKQAKKPELTTVNIPAGRAAPLSAEVNQAQLVLPPTVPPAITVTSHCSPEHNPPFWLLM